MWRGLGWVCAGILIATSAGADTAPSGKKYVPRKVEILDLEQAGDDVVVVHPCHPLIEPSGFDPNYCVLSSSGPFRVNGRPYLLPRKRIHLEAVDVGEVPADQPKPLRIKELSKYGDETSKFFQQSPLVRPGRPVARDRLMLSSSSDVRLVFDIWRVVKSSTGPAEIVAEKVLFVCGTGHQIEQPPPKNPEAEPLAIPACPGDRGSPPAPRPAPSASVAPSAVTEQSPRSRTAFALAVGLGLLAIGAVAALVSKKQK